MLSQQSDIVAPLHGLANFNASTISYSSSYPHTLFRLPLRTHSSGLSENVYTVQRLQELLDALREEAKFLLLFLKSVNKIEVIHVSQTGQQSLSFCVEIAPANKAAICSHREYFMQQLQTAHKQQPYRISNVISFTARFTVIVTDQNPRSNQAGTSEWLVANYAGSADASAKIAAQQQKVFPWVGAALELGTSSAGGRIFCFLPMPVEASSGLPIHVNGTFGLNDERRTLKWPGVERRNDPTANWNRILVSKLLPHCYAMLLCEAKKHLSPQQFYRAWPKVNIVKRTQFMEILQPLFASLFSEAVVWTERTPALRQVGEWILITQATFISEGSKLASVVCRALSNCGMKLATIPSNIWEAFRHNRVGVTKVNPQLTRAKLRSYPQSYMKIDPIGKRELLQYCLSDNYYQDLSGLYLLPLANNRFTNFNYTSTHVYLCTSDCPSSLLPNLEHLLVDVIDDTELHSSLSEVSSSQETKLRTLTESEVAKLLPQAMPSDWQRSSVVVLPNVHLPVAWFETFWKWLQNRRLQLFNNQLIIPVYQSTNQNSVSFYITRLSTQSAVVYIGSYVSCSSSMLSALYKMNVMVCQQREFSFVHHRQLAGYMKQFDTNGVLDAIAQQSTYSRAVFTQEEADGLRTFLTDSSYAPNPQRRTVLQNLCIFSSAANSSGMLFSFSTGSTQSLAQRALGEPAKSVLSVANLPSNLVLFSRSNYYQLQLLQCLQVTFPTDTRLLLDHIFPLIQGRSFPDHLMDGLMTEVIDMFQVLNAKDNSLAITIQILPFLSTVSGGRKSPKDLFDPSNDNVIALYNGEDVFPLAPFNTAQRLQVLRYCGLQTSVSPQQVLDIISSISAASSSQPRCVSSARFSRAKTILEYISTNDFRRKTSGNYQLRLFRGKYSFSSALHTLATKRSWLPVMGSCPPEYPEQLSWKGSSFNCHFISLTTSVAVVSQFSSQSLPCLVGTQMYIAVPSVHLTVANVLPTNAETIVQHIVAHFRVILACKEQLSVVEMVTLVHRVYSYLNDDTYHSRQLYSIQEWIFIKKQNKFVSPAVVALQQNQTFRQNLEPYVYILPDALSQYTNLFSTSSGVSRSVSQSQILSVLKMIRDDAQAVNPRSSAQEAWSTVVNILNWLTNNGTNDASVVGGEDVLVPVESESVWPKLKEASDVVYTDNDFLKTFLQDSDERDCYIFVHEQINPRLAKSLGVEPLSEYLELSEDTFEDAGQYEPLTVRLKNILRDYKDGLTIVKELLQNADDAEATEVNICYDTRQHEVNPKKLFFSGMAKAHGPALIVHNNKTFTDEDFANITKLAAATKQAKALKIGKFGIGFCSVYHMTDAPSFISRDRLYIFDPTLSYLRKEIKNPARPGKKIVFTNKIIARYGQLSPYDGLFGFNRSSSYEGTMFRLPFRSSASELSSTCYSEATVQELITAIQESNSSLLLFLQNVKCITFQQINQGETSPSVLLRVTRDSVPMPVALPAGIEVRRLSCSQTSSGLTSVSKWLVSLQSESDWLEKYYTASVACPLRQTDNPSCYKIEPSFRGEIFCFLPLSQKTGLPVHVSSNFAVINNRRGIWTSDDATSQTDAEVMWNVVLMQGVIPKAYHALLIALKSMTANLQDYIFHCLWPLRDKLMQHNPWEKMVSCLYQLISESDLFYSDYLKVWLELYESQFLQPSILCQSSEENSLVCVTKVVQKLGLPIVDLPRTYRLEFNLEVVTIDEHKFTVLFFKNLVSLEDVPSERNEVIRHMLEVYASEYDDETERSYSLHEYFKDYPCIPCAPDGIVLKHCDKVVNPCADFAQLFDVEEHFFPVTELTDRHIAVTALLDLGMISTYIPWDMLIERTHTVQKLYLTDRTKALARVRIILAAKTQGKAPTDGTTLASIPFLPVMQKPTKNYFLSWKGDECSLGLMCGKELVRARREGDQNVMISGSQVSFVCDSNTKGGECGPISDKMLEMLQICELPAVSDVIEHLKELIELLRSQVGLSDDLISWTSRTCRSIYEFLDRRIQYASQRLEEEPDLTALECSSWIWTGREFVETDDVARRWTMSGPYLYSLPSSLSDRSSLTEALDVKEEFEFCDIQNALIKMKEDFGGRPVDDTCKGLLEKLISPLLHVESPSTIMFPDENFVMHPSEELSYNDAPWIPKDEQYTYVNEIIPRELAKKLGVNPVRNRMLEMFDSTSHTYFNGVPFGQHEELTQRIQNILRDYPFDITVLKELLQNSDDAKATKMYVILDKRTHGNTSVISERWNELQGPALLVWNNREFTEEDLVGIQKLGLGSKRSDTESIGQYGIGFNVVYHLTDCPSFITGGETMCVLDPHCRYAPGADGLKPGRRYDQLKQNKFWDKFPDMKSAYLQGGLDDGAPDFSSGSLFRFPLRCTADLLKRSKIVVKTKLGEPEAKPLTAEKMWENLSSWAPQMKDAMFFLNHVKELRFYVIEDQTSVLVTLKHFETHVDERAQENRDLLHTKLSAFKNVIGNDSCIVRYPLTISETVHYRHSGRTEIREEKWLIQQGVGDSQNSHQTWKFIDNVKPRHGIAAPLEAMRQEPVEYTRHMTPYTPQRKPVIFSGQVFCFLPLPLKSRLPVHINGHFVLHSNRRDLWHPTIPDKVDSQTAWNESLFQAIASSYANFLLYSQPHYVTVDSFEQLDKAVKVFDHYYEVFPHATSKGLQTPYLELAKNVYKSLLDLNSKVLAVIVTEKGATCTPSTEHDSEPSNPLQVQWHPIRSSDPSTQVYFWKRSSKWKEEDVKPIIESIGMNLTLAPRRIQEHINNEMTEEATKLEHTSPESVYAYYIHFSDQASQTTQFPCELIRTVFGNVAVFKTFLKYLLQPSEENSKVLRFPEEPFGQPLLLTADETLRTFNRGQKVLRSEFSHLFTQSLDKFLHPELLDIAFAQDLFVCAPLEDNIFFAGNLPEFSVVCDILTKELPLPLKTSKVCASYEQHISKEDLKAFWECLAEDSLFNFFLSSITKQWALLPTADGQLFSASNHMLPVFPLVLEKSAPKHATVGSSAYKMIQDVYLTLVDLGLPVLATDLIYGAQVSCPTLYDHKIVLTNLFHLHREKKLSSCFNMDVVLRLISYFKAINFKSEPSSCTHIQSLPLFENIDGTFTSLQGKTAYVWPSKACKTAYQKWLRRYEVVFLKPHGDWKQLGSSDELHIKSLSAEEVYINYIFEAFSDLNKSERYEHLNHIRTKMIETCKHYRDTTSNVDDRARNNASTFIAALARLPCIGSDNEQLRPVSEFYNHKIKVFATFKESFRFLPSFFTRTSKTEDSWLSFFEGIGLNVTLSKEEYLHLCEETSRGKHKDPKKASNVLVAYLFLKRTKEKLKWYNQTDFLQKVSDIPFVCMKQLPKFTWICPAAPSCNKIRCGDEVIAMTKLKEVAVLEEKILIWTVKPVVALTGYERWLATKEDEQLLQNLQVTQTPQVSHVIQNITNICKTSKLANQKLFDNYPESLKPPPDRTDLITVMLNQFMFLASKKDSVNEMHYGALRALPCIPVYSTVAGTHTSQVVLVKPHTVVIRFSDIEIFHPFLHSLPDNILSARDILTKIEVADGLQLRHMQVVLEACYETSKGDELDVNTKQCVIEVIKCLYKLLKEKTPSSSTPMITLGAQSTCTVEESLSPLYLPTVDRTLALSTSLVYADDPNYRFSTNLNLAETAFKEISIESSLYSFLDSAFCALLPENVRPFGLSKICTLHIGDDCQLVEDSQVAKQLKTTLALNTVSKGCLSVVKCITHQEDIIPSLEPIFIQFISNISVITVNGLKTTVTLKDSGREICRAKVPCFLQTEPSSSGTTYKLFIDSTLKEKDDDAVESLCNHLMSLLEHEHLQISDSHLRAIEKLLPIVLKADSNENMRASLDRKGIGLDGIEMDEVEFHIGKDIPQCWHHRLDQDIDNVFHPGEKVGYQISETHIVYAEILDPVLPEGYSSIDSVPNLEMQYKVFVSTDHKECCIVSVLDLFKFLRSSFQGILPEDEEVTDLVPYEGETETSQLREQLRHEDIEDIKKDLMKKLDEIWKLPEKERQKAIRRLYLRWHPDKNRENPEVAEEIFKFLLSEIEQRKCGKLPQSQWASTARDHGYFWEYEFRNRHSRRHGGASGGRGWSRGWGGGGGGSSSGGRSSSYRPPFDREDFQMRGNPVEGKRWLRQAEVDFATLQVLCDELDEEPNVSCTVCFMAHQVAEKALKAGKYYVCGLSEDARKTTDLTTHANGLQHERPRQTYGLASHTSALENYYSSTRYPHCWELPTIPADHFTAEQAREAKKNAEAVLEIIKRIVV